MEAASQSQLTWPGRIFANARGLVRRILPVGLALAAGLMLRLWMVKEFFQVDVDSLIYGGLAKNLLLHGRYALSLPDGGMYSTLIRLPGYPLFLAFCFQLFGMENYASACWVQIVLELCGCVLLADFAGRIAPVGLKTGAARATLWLGALCPFTAIYSAQPLTEAPTVFLVTLALWAVARFNSRPGWGSALAFTFAASYAALLRPDGALVAVALVPAMVFGLRRKWRDTGVFVGAEDVTEEGRFVGEKTEKRSSGAEQAAEKGLNSDESPEKHPSGAEAPADFAGFMYGLKPVPFTGASFSAAFEAHADSAVSEGGTGQRRAPKLLRMVVVCVFLALLPFGVWTARNWTVFHVFQPLVTSYATDPGEATYPGWQRWIKTWCLDFSCTYDVYWPVPGEPLELNKLPGRAFDSPAQYDETAALAADYNVRDEAKDIVPDIDARFGQLAEERIAAHPLRYYLWLPLGRVANMWFRPRIDYFPIDLDWWVYEHHRNETRISWGFAGLNVLYLMLAAAGLWLRPRLGAWMLAYILLRSAMLLSIEAPETRYTLECFPMLLALGGIGLYWFTICVWRLVSRTNALEGRR